MAKTQAVWAIDIGQAALKALKLVPTETNELVLAETFDFVEYPKILSQPDADPEELVREALLTFLGRNDLKGCKVAIAVPGQAGLVKFIKLPPVEKKRIPDIVKFEARQQIPFALEEVLWDYQAIKEPGQEEEEDDDFAMVEVGLFAMKRDQIHRALLPLKAAGIEVDIVQMSPIALYNFVAFDQMTGENRPDGAVVLLDIGVDNTDLIITDGSRIWQRNVPIGGNHFTRALTKELKLTFAKAEHLKKNATKSQDPRAVFTAMRGVFNDLSSEISRSIGFYSSVNRQSKIAKVIGLGNGFKLPGLQKFLQQNLNQDVERLDVFRRLAGDEVITSPQFSENLMSFAVAYGLAVQGLGLSSMRTNLLPPEIEQVRMIRRKKPWALTAAALLLLGFTAMYIGDWSARAKVVNPKMEQAIKTAKSAADRGAQLKSAFDTSRTAFDSKKAEGEALVTQSAQETGWDTLLARVNAALPNPARELGVDPNAPDSQEILSILRVHVDAILPRYRMDVGADWFSTSALEGFPKDYMHPYDRANPPTGEGWIIQIIGHHYNPSPIGAEAAKLSEQVKPFAFGPIPYLTQRVVPRLWTAPMRQFGIHHATLAWVEIDDKWVSSKVGAGSPVPAAPVMPRQAAPARAAMSGYPSGTSEDMSSEGAMMNSMYGAMMANYGGSGSMEDMAYSMSPYMGGYPGMNPMAKDAPEQTTLTRTNFLIQFVWQPPTPDAPPPTIEEIRTLLDEAASKSQGAIKPLSDQEIAKITEQSQTLLQRKRQEQLKALTGPAGGSTAAAKGQPAAKDAAPKASP